MAIETRSLTSPAPPDTTKILQGYLQRVFELERREDVREESFYSSLEELLVRCAGHLNRGDVRVTVIPKRREGHLLDFQVWRGGRPVGYVEAKRPGTDLQRVEESPQLERYKAAFPNLILTNFHQFRLYREGERVARADIASPFAARLLPRELMAGAARVEGEPALLALLDGFFTFEAPWSGSASSLAVAMAGRTRELAARMEEILEREEGRDGKGTFTGLHQAFAEYLLGRLSRREFADLYAQTVAYGMLAARWRSPEGFDRATLFDRIPRTNGILRDVFRYISLGDPPPEVRWILDDLAHLLAPAPVRGLLERHYHAGRGKDPILHFYETFLASYDRDLRRRRGVFYTPQPVVAYVVRSVHRLLADRLGLDGGLAHPGVCLLDPAAGTLTFVAEALREAAAAHRERFGDGAVPALVRDRLLPNFHAFELMMAPYAIGHLHLGLVLAELGCPLEEEDRFGLYLTDALDARELKQAALPGLSSLARESHLAGRLKKEVPEGCSAFVVVGNPPWLGRSSQRSSEVRDGYLAPDGRRDEGYYRLDGQPLGEANPRWLQDDYVQFIRFAQRRIDEVGQGVLGFVTNHGYLDNPTFRGMRASLLGTFDELYVLDLHGNMKKKERSPDGSRDENVFEGVRQGVAIALFVKKPGLPRRVWRADLHGSHAEKLRWLSANDVASTPWRELRPEAPAYLFAPCDVDLEKEYLRGTPLPKIFPRHSAGVVTARDAFAIDRDPRELEARIGNWCTPTNRGPFTDLRNTGTWSLEKARRRALADEDWRTRFQKILYRPFDERHVFYADYLLERPRENVMRHMLAGGNLGLVAPRQSKDGAGALVTDRIVAHKAVSAYDINYLFPLWLLPEEEDGLFKGETRKPNLAPDLLRSLDRLYGEEPEPEEVLGYVYAVLYSPTYRERYAPLLRQDFPRIPFPWDRHLFEELAALGTELIGLHLLRTVPACPSATFQGKGNGTTGRAGFPRYDPAERQVVINECGQCFQGIEPEVWDYRIGGYQVLRRWLQARAGLRLLDDEIRSFCRTVAVLEETIRLQRGIDALYVAVGDSQALEACSGP
ncbi:MAG TPA: type ISP restriction/modification enzyme [Thermoanaerobaculia bacterium]|nr:type ISP restriction/modification enzyme [Thermoanaerobaculia bacterium]